MRTLAIAVLSLAVVACSLSLRLCWNSRNVPIGGSCRDRSRDCAQWLRVAGGGCLRARFLRAPFLGSRFLGSRCVLR